MNLSMNIAVTPDFLKSGVFQPSYTFMYLSCCAQKSPVSLLTLPVCPPGSPLTCVSSHFGLGAVKMIEAQSEAATFRYSPTALRNGFLYP